MNVFQQKGPKMRIHLQQAVADELVKLQEDGHMKKKRKSAKKFAQGRR